jgi:hypothetical protein
MKKKLLPTLIFAVCLLAAQTAKAGVLSITMGHDFNQMMAMPVTVASPATGFIWVTATPRHHKKKKHLTPVAAVPIPENNSVIVHHVQKKAKNQLDISFVDQPVTKTNTNSFAINARTTKDRSHSGNEERLTNSISIILPQPFRLPDKKPDYDSNRDMLGEKRLGLYALRPS